MHIARRLDVFARRLPGAKPGKFWHGTTSKLLRSIQVNGLDPSKIKFGIWQTDEREPTSYFQQSFISFGGIYYARSFLTSLNYADNAAEKFGGNPLMILVQLQEMSSEADEDTLPLWQVFLKYNGIKQTENNKLRGVQMYELIQAVNPRNQEDRDFLQFSINAYRYDLLEKVDITKEQIQQKPYYNKLMELIGKYYIAACWRVIAHSRELLDKEPTAQGLEVPSIAEAEANYRQAADQVLRLLGDEIRRSLLDSDRTAPERTLRMLQPVGFRGRNKIIGIYELVDYKKLGMRFRGRRGNRPRVIVHYGVPVEFTQQPLDYAPLTGNYLTNSPYRWISRDGEALN